MLTITPEIIASFRLDFEGFADDTVWPSEKLTRILQLADRETGSSRWGGYSDQSIKQRGMFYFAAHTLLIKKKEAAATSSGKGASALNPVQSKSVGDESITYAVSASSNGPTGNEALQATSYGQEFLRLRRRVGRGGANSNMAGLPC